MSRPILIMAGGTGGHVFPALAVAEKLRANNVPVIWLGTQRGIESTLVPAAGIEIRWLSVNGLRGKNKLTLLMAPVKLLWACIQAARVLLSVRPAAVLGMGGFVSGPGGLMAALLGKPLLIHEQNAIPGLTNRLLSKLATKVIESFPSSFNSQQKAVLVGNPVRDNILKIAAPAERLAGRNETLNILVVGGSLGAAVLNQTVPEAVSKLENTEVNVWHQTGKKNIEEARAIYQQFKVEARIDAFIDDMAAAYEWADLVICRSGAMTVSELAVAGVASVLVPYPYAVDDHQTANAHFLSEQAAAILVPQPELTADRLKQIIESLNREKILVMSEAAKHIAKPEAANTVAQFCIQAGGLA